MASRRNGPKPSLDLIKHKVGEARFFLQHLRQHRDRQRDAAKPPPEEFDYYFSAYLNAARSVGKLIERVMGRQKKWWETLNKADQDLHYRFDKMRHASVYEGQVKTKRKTEKVPISHHFDPHRMQVVRFGFQDMFGVALTEAQTRSVDLGDVEREVVELCDEYLGLLTRVVEGHATATGS